MLVSVKDTFLRDVTEQRQLLILCILVDSDHISDEPSASIFRVALLWITNTCQHSDTSHNSVILIYFKTGLHDSSEPPTCQQEIVRLQQTFVLCRFANWHYFILPISFSVECSLAVYLYLFKSIISYPNIIFDLCLSDLCQLFMNQLGHKTRAGCILICTLQRQP